VPELLAGRMLCAQLFTEPQTGSDLAAIATSARKTGSGFVLSGVKWLNSVAHVASHLWIIARTGSAPRHRGLSMFLIPADTPGVTIEPLVEMTGVHRLNQIVLDEAEVGADALVGPLDGGWKVAMDAVTRERSGSTRTSSMRRTISELAGHRPSGRDRPLIEDPAAELELAALSVRIDACDSLWFRYSWQTDSGLANPDLAGATLKVYGDAIEQDLADAGSRLLERDGVRDIDDAAPLGGRLARLHLAGPGLSVGGGVAEVLKSIIATRGLGLPRDPWQPPR
jgi:alkylation response protein AidB-like acyl-CoA dehydrogenase